MTIPKVVSIRAVIADGSRIGNLSRWPQLLLAWMTIVVALSSPTFGLVRQETGPGSPTRVPWLGVSRWLVNQQQVVVCGVLPDGPAGKAGVQVDDTIVSIDGQKISDVATFHRVVDGLPMGQSTKLEIERNGNTLVINLVPELLPDDGGIQRIASAAENGEAWAMMEMGVRTANMRGDRSYIKSDFKAAVDWFQRAVAAGDTVAPLFLAHMYLKGQGVEQDHAMAQKYFLLARKNVDDPKRVGARKGLASAASNALANMCRLEQGPETRPELAQVFWKDAANHGSPAAMCALGKLYEQGEFVDRDVETAIRWYRTAARLQYPLAIESLARLEPTSAKNSITQSKQSPDTSAPGETPSAKDADHRSFWIHDAGFFRHIGNGVWTESFRDPAVIGHSYSFREVARTNEHVELYDETRDMRVRLTNDSFLLKQPQDQEFLLRTNGSWKLAADYSK